VQYLFVYEKSSEFPAIHGGLFFIARRRGVRVGHLFEEELGV
jgi:hypothetical protein